MFPNMHMTFSVSLTLFLAAPLPSMSTHGLVFSLCFSTLQTTSCISSSEYNLTATATSASASPLLCRPCFICCPKLPCLCSPRSHFLRHLCASPSPLPSIVTLRNAFVDCLYHHELVIFLIDKEPATSH